MHVQLEPHAMANTGILESSGLTTVSSSNEAIVGRDSSGTVSANGEKLNFEPFLRGGVVDSTAAYLSTGSSEKPPGTSAVLSASSMTAREASFQEETQRILMLQAEITALKAHSPSNTAVSQGQPVALAAVIPPPPPPPPPPPAAIQHPAPIAALPSKPTKTGVVPATSGSDASKSVLSSLSSSSSTGTSKDIPQKDKAVRKKLASGCEVIDGVDYRAAPGASEKLVENLSLEGCCAQCVAESCAVAVYSSVHDAPPQGCWLKSRVAGPAIAKAGVQACARPEQVATLEELNQAMKAPSLGAGRTGGGSSGKATSSSMAMPKLAYLPPASTPGSSNSSSSSSSSSRAGANGAGADALTREQVLEGRAAAIASAMAFAWANYREHAWGSDNLLPISGRGTNAGFNHAVTMVRIYQCGALAIGWNLRGSTEHEQRGSFSDPI